MLEDITDIYFTKAKLVAQFRDMNPIVKYRVFCRKDGITALQPARYLIQQCSPNVTVEVLPEGIPFKGGDTLMILTGRFQELVELETLYLQWIGLPVYCATQARAIREAAPDTLIYDFAARHLCGIESVALASYGAQVGGMDGASTRIGASASTVLAQYAKQYGTHVPQFDVGGIGTMPHALFAIFRGDYSRAVAAYAERFSNEDNITVLVDYNNQEVFDTLKSFRVLGKRLGAVRIDTCGENYSQSWGDVQVVERGVSIMAVHALSQAMDTHNIDAKIVVSSGFNAEKTSQFMRDANTLFDRIGTGSFVPPNNFATSDIFEVDGIPECKVGREWGFAANCQFYRRLLCTVPSASVWGFEQPNYQPVKQELNAPVLDEPGFNTDVTSE